MHWNESGSGMLETSIGQHDSDNGNLRILCCIFPQIINSGQRLPWCFPQLSRKRYENGGFQRHLTGKAELIPLFPVFLDYAFADLTKAIDCVALNVLLRVHSASQRVKKRINGQSRTWKVIQMQLVINLTLCFHYALRKPASLGHFVLWWLTPHAIIPNPKGYGPLAWSALLDCFPSLLETLLLEVFLWWGRWTKQQAKNQRVRWGSETWLSLILKTSLLWFFEKSSNHIFSRILGLSGKLCGPILPWKPLQGSAPIGWILRTPSHCWFCSPRSGGIFLVSLSLWSFTALLVWIFSFSIIHVTHLCTNFLLFERYRMTYVFFTAISLVCSAQTIL